MMNELTTESQGKSLYNNIIIIIHKKRLRFENLAWRAWAGDSRVIKLAIPYGIV
jgi:hypothetical protein